MVGAMVIVVAMATAIVVVTTLPEEVQVFSRIFEHQAHEFREQIRPPEVVIFQGTANP